MRLRRPTELIQAEPVANKGRSQHDYGHDADGGQTRDVPAGFEQVTDFLPLYILR